MASVTLHLLFTTIRAYTIINSHRHIKYWKITPQGMKNNISTFQMITFMTLIISICLKIECRGFMKEITATRKPRLQSSAVREILYGKLLIEFKLICTFCVNQNFTNFVIKTLSTIAFNKEHTKLFPFSLNRFSHTFSYITQKKTFYSCSLIGT